MIETARDCVRILNALQIFQVSKYGVFSGPNTAKYGPEKTRYLDTFCAVFG